MAKQLVKGIEHISLSCTDEDQLQTVLEFYQSLGFTIVRQWDKGGIWPAFLLEAGGIGIEVFMDADEDLPQGAIRHFALATDDVDDCVEHCRNRGLKITTEPKDVTLNSEPPVDLRLAFVEGPVGETIEFLTHK